MGKCPYSNSYLSASRYVEHLHLYMRSYLNPYLRLYIHLNLCPHPHPAIHTLSLEALNQEPSPLSSSPQPGLPEGVLTFSIKECLRVPRPSGSPNAAGRFPRPMWAGSPTSKIQTPNYKKPTIQTSNIQNQKYTIQNETKTKVQTTKSKLQNPTVQNPKS